MFRLMDTRSALPRTLRLVLVLALTTSLAACDDKSKPIITAPPLPPAKGTCGIPSAGPGVGTCHGLYTYYLTADAKGISHTAYTWYIGGREILAHGVETDGDSARITRTFPTRQQAGIIIHATHYSRFETQGRFGAGCTIAVRDGKGERVGMDVVVTRPRTPYQFHPYDTARCEWH
jgi:hypothetical protein